MTTATLPSRSRLGLSILGWGLGLGLLGDLLLRAPWGANFSIWICALMGAGIWLAIKNQLPVSRDFSWLALSVVLCAIAFVRRDSQALQLVDLAALVGLLSLTALATQGGSIRLRGVSTYLLATFLACAHAWFGTPRLLFGDISWNDVHRPGRWRQLRAVAIGLILAAPLLLVFGGLFAAADAGFQALVNSVQIDFPNLASHLFFTGLIGGLSAGALRGACLGEAETAGAGERAQSPALRFTSAATVLGALDLLFLVFVVLQLRWLFGGAAVIAETTGLTMAEYARRGFFELVTASALVLPVLLVADWATLVESPRQRRAFRVLAGLLVAMVGVMLVSALQRMLLYVQTFGLTELRVYTTAFMVWLGGVFAWYSWTVLRGARPRFAFGALAHAIAVVGALHVANPDALIARVNTSRATAQQTDGAYAVPFDAAYAAGTLSADAVLVLLERLHSLPAAEQATVAHHLLERWGPANERDWRSWNWSASRARTLVKAQARELTSLQSTAAPTLPR